MNFEDAIAAAGSNLLLIKDAWCPTHGRVRPEMMAFPFSTTPECLAFQSPFCPMPTCENDIEVDVEVVVDPFDRTYCHWESVLRDGISVPRVVIANKPDRPGHWLCGSRIGPNGELIDDHPSGAALTRE